MEFVLKFDASKEIRIEIKKVPYLKSQAAHEITVVLLADQTGRL